MMHIQKVKVICSVASKEIKEYLAVFDNVIKQFSPRHILHHHEDICGGTDHLIPVQTEKPNKQSNQATGVYRLVIQQAIGL